MQIINKIFLACTLLFALVGIASADTHIPAGSVDFYTLGIPGEKYILDGDITSIGTAFSIQADNVTLDGQGHNISYAQTALGYGVVGVSHNNVTIKNVKIKQVNSTINYAHGIYLNSANDSVIINCTSNTYTAYAISLYGCCNNTVSNCTCCAFDVYGMNIYECIRCKINNSVSTANTTVGLMIENGNFNQLTNASGISSTSMGLMISASKNNILTNCKGTSGSGIGMSSYISTNNTFVNASAYSTNGRGLEFLNEIGNTIVGGNATSISSNGMYCENSTDCSITDIDARSNALEGMCIINSTKNTFRNISAVSQLQRGIYLSGSYNNSFVGTTVDSPYAKYPSTGVSIILLGDSTTAGTVNYYGGWRGAFANDLGQGYTVSNMASGGSQTFEMRAAANESLAIFNPKYVYILCGTNDISYGRSEQDIINDVMATANMSQSAGAKVYICTVLPRSTQNDVVIHYNENLTKQVQAAGYTIVNTYDAIDSIPDDGQFDGFVAGNYADGIHPTGGIYDSIGHYVANKTKASNGIYTGGCSLDPNGMIQKYNNSVRVPMTLIPDKGEITVSIQQWNDTKIWKESAEIHDIVTQHIMEGFPANTPVHIFRDNAMYAVVTSNSTGYIDWTYSGGYSEHTFEAIAGKSITLTVTSTNGLNSYSEAATNIALSAETQYTGMGALYKYVNDTISRGYTLASLIVLVIGAFALFRYMGYI